MLSPPAPWIHFYLRRPPDDGLDAGLELLGSCVGRPMFGGLVLGGLTFGGLLLGGLTFGGLLLGGLGRGLL
ncbi:MAG: hypothetical protein QNK24_02275 [Desulfuromusa sp.]|nr:hypothetical protein [Desulfuromusa sp.]